MGGVSEPSNGFPSKGFFRVIDMPYDCSTPTIRNVHFGGCGREWHRDHIKNLPVQAEGTLRIILDGREIWTHDCSDSVKELLVASGQEAQAEYLSCRTRLSPLYIYDGDFKTGYTPRNSGPKNYNFLALRRIWEDDCTPYPYKASVIARHVTKCSITGSGSLVTWDHEDVSIAAVRDEGKPVRR